MLITSFLFGKIKLQAPIFKRKIVNTMTKIYKTSKYEICVTTYLETQLRYGNRFQRPLRRSKRHLIFKWWGKITIDGEGYLEEPRVSIVTVKDLQILQGNSNCFCQNIFAVLAQQVIATQWENNRIVESEIPPNLGFSWTGKWANLGVLNEHYISNGKMLWR